MQVISRPLEAGIFVATSYFSTPCHPMPIVRGYDEETDSILIMDVARFKYPPHWVPLTDLTDAMLKARWTLSWFLSCHTFVSRMLLNLVGGFKHLLFSITYGIILPIDFHIFQDG